MRKTEKARLARLKGRVLVCNHVLREGAPVAKYMERDESDPAHFYPAIAGCAACTLLELTALPATLVCEPCWRAVMEHTIAAAENRVLNWLESTNGTKRDRTLLAEARRILGLDAIGDKEVSDSE